MSEKAPDPDVLGRILLLQSTLHAMPGESELGEFVCRGVSAVPGVASTALCVGGRMVARLQTCPDDWSDPADGHRHCEDLHGPNPNSAAPCPWWDAADVVCLRLRTSSACYGGLLLRLSSAECFSLYLAYLENTTNLVALILENRRQEAKLRRFNSELENRVQERSIRPTKAASEIDLCGHTDC